MSAEPGTRPPASPDPEWLQLVRTQVESLRYGLVQLVVHDGKVTQIERTEKTRLLSHAGESARAV
jgi:hypothetical protein